MGKPPQEDDSEEWTFSLREIFQDAQVEAVEEAQYHSSKQKSSQSGGGGGGAATAKETTSGGDAATVDKEQEEENRERDERALLPAVRRLQLLYRTEIDDGNDLIEEKWAVFLEEMWVAMGRVLVAPKLHAIILGTISSLVGMFLRGSGSSGPLQKDKPPTSDPSSKSMQELRTELLNRLMDATKADEKTVRLRACEMLQLILNKIDTIGEETLTRLRTTVLPRASDKLAPIRFQSVLVLQRVQDETNEADEVTLELMRLMVSDPNKDVRKVALQNVAVTKATYKDLMIRIRDVSDEVRAAAFHVFRDRMPLKKIAINDRAQLLDQGLHDRSPMVRTACEQMLVDRWLVDSKHSPARLLRALDVEHFTGLCTKVSKLLLKYFTSNQPFAKVVASIDVAYVLSSRDDEDGEPLDLEDALDGASVFFWREQCAYFHDDDKDEEKLATLLPSISDYIKVLALAGSHASGKEAAAKQRTDAAATSTAADDQPPADIMFVMQQLLALGHSLDYQDEYGRRVLLDALRKLLGDPSVDNGLTPSIMELMASIYAVGNAQNDFVRVVAEILSDLYDPVDSQTKGDGDDDDDDDDENEGEQQPMAHPTASEEELEAATRRFEFLEEHIETLEYESAEYLAAQQEMEDLEVLLQDPKVLAWLRCLEILAQLLKLTNFNVKHPVLSGVGRYILPAIESDIPAIRETGLECLGLFCLLDRNIAERYLVVFWRALNHDDEERDVKMTCIRSIMDMVFSFSNLTPHAPVPSKEKSTADEKDAEKEDGDEEEEKEGETEPEAPLQLDTIFMGLAQLAATSYDDLDVQSTIVEGFAKLFLMHRVRSPPVLAFFLDTFFSPKLQKVQLLSEHGYQARALQLMSVFFPTFVKASTSNCSLFEEAAIYLVQKTIDKYEVSDAERSALAQIDLVTCCKYIFHLLSHTDDAATSTSEAKIKNEAGEETTTAAAAAAATVNQRCAHHNRVAINMCVDLLALEKLKGSPGPKIDLFELESRQKLLAKVVALTDISAAERRSALLLLSLLKEVAETCFSTQKTVGKSVEALLKRLTTTYALGRRQLGKAKAAAADEDSNSVLEQDQEWSNDRIAERAKQLRAGIKECAVTRRRVRRSSANSSTASGRRGSQTSARRRVASNADDSEDEEEDVSSSDEDVATARVSGRKSKGKTEESPAPPPRRASARQSKSDAVDKMRTKNREFDVAMKMAFEDDEEDDDEGDDDDGDDDEGEDESMDEGEEGENEDREQATKDDDDDEEEEEEEDAKGNRAKQHEEEEDDDEDDDGEEED